MSEAPQDTQHHYHLIFLAVGVIKDFHLVLEFYWVKDAFSTLFFKFPSLSGYIKDSPEPG